MDRGLAESVRSSFISKFRTEPALIWSPGRINIIGEHTDYNQGFVLPAAIDRGIIMAIGRAEKGSGKWIAMDVGEEFTPTSSHQQQEVNGWISYLMGILSELGKIDLYPDPVDLAFSGNIPPGAGLSSSAAIENAFVFGLNEIYEMGLGPMEMVRISHAAEQYYVGVQCGIMDQYASMFGQEEKAIFLDCKSLQSEYLPLHSHPYEWILLDSRVKHSLANSAYNQRRKACEDVAARLGVNSLREISLDQLEQSRTKIPEGDYQKALYVLEENSRTLKAREAIGNQDMQMLGELMYQSHEGLSKQYGVSCEELDFLVDLARGSNGVLGARMMGGGFGGCTLNLVHKRYSSSFVKSVQSAYAKRFGVICVSYSVKITNGCHTIRILK